MDAPGSRQVLTGLGLPLAPANQSRHTGDRCPPPRGGPHGRRGLRSPRSGRHSSPIIPRVDGTESLTRRASPPTAPTRPSLASRPAPRASPPSLTSSGYGGLARGRSDHLPASTWSRTPRVSPPHAPDLGGFGGRARWRASPTAPLSISPPAPSRRSRPGRPRGSVSDCSMTRADRSSASGRAVACAASGAAALPLPLPRAVLRRSACGLENRRGARSRFTPVTVTPPAE